MGPKLKIIDRRKKVEDQINDILSGDFLHKIENDLEVSGSIDVYNSVAAIFLHLFSPLSSLNLKKMKDDISNLVEENEKQKKKIEELENKIKDLEENQSPTPKIELEKQVQQLEVDNYKTKFLIGNIPMEASDSNETTEKPEVTTKILEEILTISGQNLSSVKEVKRLYPKGPQKRPNVKTPPPTLQQKDPRIFVNFTSMEEVKKFTSKFKEIRNMEKFRNLTCDNYCPPSMLKEYHLANEKAYFMRKEENLKTKTLITKNRVILKVKMNGEESFTEVKWRD